MTGSAWLMRTNEFEPRKLYINLWLLCLTGLLQTPIAPNRDFPLPCYEGVLRNRFTDQTSFHLSLCLHSTPDFATKSWSTFCFSPRAWSNIFKQFKWGGVTSGPVLTIYYYMCLTPPEYPTPRYAAPENMSLRFYGGGGLHIA